MGRKFGHGCYDQSSSAGYASTRRLPPSPASALKAGPPFGSRPHKSGQPSYGSPYCGLIVRPYIGRINLITTCCMRSYNPLAYARMVPSSSPIPQPPAPPWLIHRMKCYRFPGIHTRRLTGRGRALVGLSTSHDTPSGELVTHLIWDFLSITDRLLMVTASPVIGAYARLRFFAASLSN